MEAKGLKAALLGGLAAVAFTLGMATPSSAETIIKFAMSEVGPDVQFDGTTFGTSDDGNAATLGDQDTRLFFEGALSSIADILDPIASFSLDDVLASGLPTVIGSVVAQSTTGGTFSFWDETNTLLLSGTLSTGVITGSSTASTGSFFNTSFATFTGGSLAALLDPNSAGLSIALTSIMSADGPGLHIGPDGRLLPFTADGAGLVEGSSAIPEPATALMLLSALGAGGVARRRKA